MAARPGSLADRCMCKWCLILEPIDRPELIREALDKVNYKIATKRGNAHRNELLQHALAELLEEAGGVYYCADCPSPMSSLLSPARSPFDVPSSSERGSLFYVIPTPPTNNDGS